MKLFLLLTAAVLFMSAKGCKEDYPVEGKTVAMIYPQYNLARVRKVAQSCPLKTSEAVDTNLADLSGWCAIPPEECAAYTRDYETNFCK